MFAGEHTMDNATVALASAASTGGEGVAADFSASSVALRPSAAVVAPETPCAPALRGESVCSWSAATVTRKSMGGGAPPSTAAALGAAASEGGAKVEGGEGAAITSPPAGASAGAAAAVAV